MAYIINSENKKLYIADKVSVKLISPLKERKNSYSLPFNIPVTHESDEFFDTASNMNSRNNKKREVEGYLIMDIVRFCGVITVLTVSDGYYNCNFTGQSATWQKMSKYLKDIDLGKIDISSRSVNSLEIQNIYFFQNDELVISFPPYYNFKKKDNFPFKIRFDSDVLINPYSMYTIAWNVYPFDMPVISLKYIISNIFKQLGFKVEKNVLDEVLFKEVMLVSNYSISNCLFREMDITPIAITKIRNEGEITVYCETATQAEFDRFADLNFVKLYDLTITNKNDFEGRIVQLSNIDKAAKKFSIDLNVDAIADTDNCGKIKAMEMYYELDSECDVAKHMPALSVADFIEMFQNIFAIVMIAYDSKQEVKITSYKEILESKDCEDITEFASDVRDIDMIETKGLSLNYIVDVDDYFGRFVVENDKDNTVKDPVATLADLPLTGNKDKDMRLVQDINQYYVWNKVNYGSRQTNNSTYLNMGSWEFKSQNFTSKKVGADDTTKIEIKAAPIIKCSSWGDFPVLDLVHNNIADINTFDAGLGKLKIVLPRMDVAASASFTKEETDPGVRLCFRNGNTESSHLSLSFDGPLGLYEKCYKEYLEWKLNRYKEGKSDITWPVRKLMNFDWDKKFKIRSTQYLVYEIDIEQEGNKPIVFGETLLARV